MLIQKKTSGSLSPSRTHTHTHTHTHLPKYIQTQLHGPASGSDWPELRGGVWGEGIERAKRSSGSWPWAE